MAEQQSNNARAEKKRAQEEKKKQDELDRLIRKTFKESGSSISREMSNINTALRDAGKDVEKTNSLLKDQHKSVRKNVKAVEDLGESYEKANYHLRAQHELVRENVKWVGKLDRNYESMLKKTIASDKSRIITKKNIALSKELSEELEKQVEAYKQVDGHSTRFLNNIKEAKFGADATKKMYEDLDKFGNKLKQVEKIDTVFGRVAKKHNFDFFNQLGFGEEGWRKMNRLSANIKKYEKEIVRVFEEREKHQKIIDSYTSKVTEADYNKGAEVEKTKKELKELENKKDEKAIEAKKEELSQKQLEADIAASKIKKKEKDDTLKKLKEELKVTQEQRKILEEQQNTLIGQSAELENRNKKFKDSIVLEGKKTRVEELNEAERKRYRKVKGTPLEEHLKKYEGREGYEDLTSSNKRTQDTVEAEQKQLEKDSLKVQEKILKNEENQTAIDEKEKRLREQIKEAKKREETDPGDEAYQKALFGDKALKQQQKIYENQLKDAKSDKMGIKKGMFGTLRTKALNSIVSVGKGIQAWGIIQLIDTLRRMILGVNESIVELGKGFGVGYTQAKSLYKQIAVNSTSSRALFLSIDNAIKAAIKFQEITKTNFVLGQEGLKNYTRMVERMGVSENTAASLIQGLHVWTQYTADNVADIAAGMEGIVDVTEEMRTTGQSSMNLKETMEQLNSLTGFTRGHFLYMANKSGDSATNTREISEFMVQAAHNARRLGLTMEQMANLSTSLFDFEKVVELENMVAVLSPGSNFSLGLSSILAMHGDMEAATAAMVDEWLKLPPIYQNNKFVLDTMASQIGLTADVLQDAIFKRKTENALTEKNATLSEQIARAEQISLDIGEGKTERLKERLKYYTEEGGVFQKFIEDQKESLGLSKKQIEGIKFRINEFKKEGLTTTQINHNLKEMVEYYKKVTGLSKTAIKDYDSNVSATQAFTESLNKLKDQLVRLNDSDALGRIVDWLIQLSGKVGRRSMVSNILGIGSKKDVYQGGFDTFTREQNLDIAGGAFGKGETFDLKAFQEFVKKGEGITTIKEGKEVEISAEDLSAEYFELMGKYKEEVIKKTRKLTKKENREKNLEAFFRDTWFPIIEEANEEAVLNSLKMGSVLPGYYGTEETLEKLEKIAERGGMQMSDLEGTPSKSMNDFILRPGKQPISFNKDDLIIGGTGLMSKSSGLSKLSEQQITPQTMEVFKNYSQSSTQSMQNSISQQTIDNKKIESLLQKLLVATESGKTINMDGYKVGETVHMRKTNLGYESEYS